MKYELLSTYMCSKLQSIYIHDEPMFNNLHNNKRRKYLLAGFEKSSYFYNIYIYITIS
jgi:hypothetical protein